MERVDHPAALLGQLVAAVGQEPQHRAVVLGADAAQVELALGHPGDAGGIDAVGLASVAAGEQASVAGTSSTVSSLAASRCAKGCPRPAAPSTAQIRSGQRSAHRRSRSRVALVAGPRNSPTTRPVGSSATAVCHALWGSMPIVVTWCLLELPGRWSTAAGNLSSREHLTPLSSHAGGGRWPSGPARYERATSSGQTQRHRLNRGGNRQLNRALHLMALVQARTYPPAQADLARRRAEGKTWREAIRCLTRHLADVVYRTMLLDLGASQAGA